MSRSEALARLAMEAGNDLDYITRLFDRHALEAVIATTLKLQLDSRLLLRDNEGERPHKKEPLNP